MDYPKLRTSQLEHLARGGDAEAKKEIGRRMRDAPAALDLTKATYLELRALVLKWRDGSTEAERAESFDIAQRAQDELAIRTRTRNRIGWRKEDAHVFGPESAVLPVAPWLIPRPPSTLSWKRPTGSTHYPSRESIERAQLNAAARAFYNSAAGVPQK